MDSSNLQNLFAYTAVFQVVVSAFLGTYMGVQALLDRSRRGPYLFFAATWFYLSLIEFLALRQVVIPQHYELLRLIWGLGYVSSLMRLFPTSGRFKVIVLGTALSTSLIMWFSNWSAMTSVVFPFLFGVGAFLHGQYFVKNRGYASAILCACSVLLAMMCADFYFALQISSQKGPEIMILGYIHYAVISMAAVIFGWVHFPRELRSQAPVRVGLKHGLSLVAVMVVAEAVYIWDFLTVSTLTPIYVGTMVVELGAIFSLYFYHRHHLVIYAANVTELLDKKTASLKVAQAELSRHNEILETKLNEQAQELQTKAEVIERQRRLELAAQTAGQAAHDIQNAISPLLTHTRELDKHAQTPSRVREFAVRIRNQIEGLLDLNGQMLALSRRGRMDLNPINLCELLETVSEQYIGGDIRLVHMDDRAWVEGSWSQLLRAATNLVSNAFEAYETQAGPVELSCRVQKLEAPQRCHLGFLQPGDYVTLRVKDYGGGVPDKIIEQIFEPFYSSKNRSVRSGSGLGLSIVTAVVDDMSGVIDLETSQEGSCFTLYFPQIPASEAQTQPHELCGNETVMVIDDDSSVLNHMDSLLSEHGYDVITANGGAEALGVMQVQEVDAIFLDFKMPEMNGLDTFFATLNIRPGTNIIVYSSFLGESEAQKLLELGAEVLLEKPASPADILKTLRLVLNGTYREEAKQRSTFA